jgi:glycosyltransferase involved in cell wall biosynthesis
VSACVSVVMDRDLLRTATARDAVARAILADSRDPDHEPPDDELFAQLPDSPYILVVGALREAKGLDPLLRAYSGLAHPPPLARIGGRAPDTADSFPPGVTVLHDASPATVMQVRRGGLFGVAPSLLPEPLGNVVHEPKSVGTPVIGTQPSGHRDMIARERNGPLVPARDVEAPRAAMRPLIDDEGLRRRLGAAASRRTGPFTPERVVPGIEQLYRKVMAACAPTPGADR